MEENIVHIVEWPKTPAILEHEFPKPVNINISTPIDVNIPKPVGLNVYNTAQQPLFVNMNLKDGDNIPICIKLCEPICAESNYKVGITLMGQPFIEIAVQGITRLFNCNGKRSTSADTASVTVK